MPDGEMRRPPQPWESKLARLTSIIGGAGIKSSGDGTSAVTPTPTPGAGGGTEPAPVLPPPGAFIAPSTPTLIGSVQGINVVWNGLNSAGDLWPSDTSYVEVHMDTSGANFTPTASTLKGRLVRPGGLAVVGLSRGTTYFFRLRGADPAGNVTTASTAASGQPGQINAPDIAANAITANTIVAGTITGWSINSAFLSGGTISGGYISGGTMVSGVLDSASIRTASSGARIEMGNFFGSLSSVAVYNSTGSCGGIFSGINAGELLIAPGSGGVITLNGPVYVNNRLDVNGVVAPNSINTGGTAYVGGKLTVGGAIDATGNISGSSGLIITGSGVDMQGVYDNNTTGLAPVGITTAGRLRRNGTSTQRIKYDITTLAGELSSSVDSERKSDVVTCDPTAILDVAVVEFSVIDEGLPTERRLLGVIAEDVDDKLPIAVYREADGTPGGVNDQALVSALLAVVKQQQQTITDLTARVTALEGA